MSSGGSCPTTQTASTSFSRPTGRKRASSPPARPIFPRSHLHPFPRADLHAMRPRHRQPEGPEPAALSPSPILSGAQLPRPPIGQPSRARHDARSHTRPRGEPYSASSGPLPTRLRRPPAADRSCALLNRSSLAHSGGPPYHPRKAGPADHWVGGTLTAGVPNRMSVSGLPVRHRDNEDPAVVSSWSAIVLRWCCRNDGLAQEDIGGTVGRGFRPVRHHHRCCRGSLHATRIGPFHRLLS